MKSIFFLFVLPAMFFAQPAEAQHGGWHGHNNYHYGHYYHYNHRPTVVFRPRVFIEPLRVHPYYYYHPVVVMRPPVPVISLNVHRTVNTSPQPEVQQMYPMSDNDFNNALNSVHNQISEDSRLAVAEEVADGNYLASAQVREMLGQFYSDGTRLAFAEYAYDHVTDQNNYYVVNDAFTSEKSVHLLSKYIADK